VDDAQLNIEYSIPLYRVVLVVWGCRGGCGVERHPYKKLCRWV